MNYFESEEIKIQEMKKSLDSVSSSFCLVRWKHATINLATGGTKSCCHHDYKEILLSNSFSNLHENDFDISQRQEMIENKRPADCSQCWVVEDQGHLSDRVNWSSRSWMSPFFKNVVENLNSKASTPSWLELNFSSVCNLKCLYCSPIFSTQWYREIKELGPYQINEIESHNDISRLNHIEFEDRYENKELMEKFWPWFDTILPDLRLLKITGGEPLLSNNTLKMMKLVSQKKSPNLTLGFNSNLSVPHTAWSQFLNAVKEIEKSQSIKKIELFPSIDSFGSRAEYIRTGLDMELFKKNVEEFLDQTNASVYFICTLNNLALGGLSELWEFLLYLKKKYFKPYREISIGTEILHYPNWLSLNILPDEMQFYLDQIITFVEENTNEVGLGFNRVELDGLKRAKSYLLAKPKDVDKQRKNMSTFLKQIDKRRGFNRLNIFPELSDFFSKF